ncbi:MAG: hypothetical protein WD928_11540 [Gammaproteobacteria bacterium]
MLFAPSILTLGSFRYLKLSAVLMLASISTYIWHTPAIAPHGGTWLGYTLGTAGAALIVWLMLFGLRKRDYRSRLGSVRGWLSAHVYLGAALVVIGTLHTGFEFGWNVHTAAYVLMLAVVASGIWGVVLYFRNPALMSGLLEGRTLEQHAEVLREIDAQSRRLAADLDAAVQALVERSAQAPLVGRLGGRLRGHVMACPTRRAVARLEPLAGSQGRAVRELYALQFQRLAQLGKMRGFLRLKAWTDVWLLFHVPLSFALLAALLAHIVAVFFYW